jgi:putative hydrolase of the HAD superfamily
MTNNNIKGIIFDMGGVFVQTIDKKPRTLLTEKFGMSYEELNTLVFQSETARLATVGSIDELEHWDFIGRQLRLDSTALEQFQKDFWDGDFLDKDLFEFAKSLKKKYALGLLSNAWSGARDFLTRKYDFLDIFDVSIFSAEIKMAKPDPKFYFWILEKLELKPQEAIFVDDFIENISAAKEIGLRTVHFKNTLDAIVAINSIL